MKIINIEKYISEDIIQYELDKLAKNLNNSEIKIVISKNTQFPKDCSTLFANASMSYIEFEKGVDTTNVTNMKQMFYSCENLKEIIGLEHLDTSNVTNMSAMFLGCKKLQKLNLANFNTSNVKDMYSMFAVCTSLEELDLSHFDTSKVENMYMMFSTCTNLKKLNLSKFNTKNVTNMEGMFSFDYALTSLDISSFNVDNVKKATHMFITCINLKEINGIEKIKNNEILNKQDLFGNQ